MQLKHDVYRILIESHSHSEKLINRITASQSINLNINENTNFERFFAMMASILSTPCLSR